MWLVMLGLLLYWPNLEIGRTPSRLKKRGLEIERLEIFNIVYIYPT